MNVALDHKYCVFPTVLGWIGVLSSDKGLQLLILPQKTRIAVESLIKLHQPAAVNSPLSFSSLLEELTAYFQGCKVKFRSSLDIRIFTNFEILVWEATMNIPHGETRSYSWIANKIGKPGAQRAVGRALHRNPIPIIIPCHRVISSNGDLRGFAGGLDMKQSLLDLESRKLDRSE